MELGGAAAGGIAAFDEGLMPFAAEKVDLGALEAAAAVPRKGKKAKKSKKKKEKKKKKKEKKPNKGKLLKEANAIKSQLAYVQKLVKSFGGLSEEALGSADAIEARLAALAEQPDPLRPLPGAPVKKKNKKKKKGEPVEQEVELQGADGAWAAIPRDNMTPMLWYSTLRSMLLRSRSDADGASKDVPSLKEKLKSVEATLASLAKKKPKEKDQGDRVSGKEDDATAAQLPEMVRLGLSGFFSFLRDTAKVHPELCIAPLQHLALTLAGFEPSQLRAESPETVQTLTELLETFANTPVPGGRGPLADAKGAALSGLLAIGMAKGRLGDVAGAALALLRNAVADADGSDGVVALRAPASVVTLQELGAGRAAPAMVLPDPEDRASSLTVEGDALAGCTPLAAAAHGQTGGAFLLALSRETGQAVLGRVVAAGSGAGCLVGSSTGPGLTMALFGAPQLDAEAPLPRGVALGLSGDGGTLLLRGPALPAGSILTLPVDDWEAAEAKAVACADPALVGQDWSAAASGQSLGAGMLLMRRLPEASSKPAAAAAGAGAGADDEAAGPGDAATAAAVLRAQRRAGVGSVPCQLVQVDYDSEAKAVTWKELAAFAVPPSASDCEVHLANLGSPKPAVAPAAADGGEEQKEAEAAAAAGGVATVESLGTASKDGGPRYLSKIACVEGGEAFAAYAVAANGELWQRLAGASGWSQTEALAGVPLRDVVASAGCSHRLMVVADGQLLAQGAGEAGQLGTAAAEDSHDAPVVVAGALKDHKVVSAAVAPEKSIVATTSGAVFAFGSDSGANELSFARRLGQKARRKEPAPVTLGDAAKGHRAVAVALGSVHTAVLLNNGVLLTAGDASDGRRGAVDGADGAFAPVKDMPAAVVGIACGSRRTIACTATGEVWVMGANDAGQALGTTHGEPEAAAADVGAPIPTVAAPTRLALPEGIGAGGDPVVSVACSGGLNVARTRSGAVVAWGAVNLGVEGAAVSALQPTVVQEGSAANVAPSPSGVVLVGKADPLPADVLARTGLLAGPGSVSIVTASGPAAAETLAMRAFRVVDGSHVGDAYVRPDADAGLAAGGPGAVAPVLAMDAWRGSLLRFHHRPGSRLGLDTFAQRAAPGEGTGDDEQDGTDALGEEKEEPLAKGPWNPRGVLSSDGGRIPLLGATSAATARWHPPAPKAAAKASDAEATQERKEGEEDDEDGEHKQEVEVVEDDEDLVAGGSSLAELPSSLPGPAACALLASAVSLLEDGLPAPAVPLGGTAKATAKGPKQPYGPMHELNRFAKGGPQKGWSMGGGQDCVCFKLDQPIYLLGVGAYGASSNLKGAVWITEGRTSQGDKLAEGEFDIEPQDAAAEVNPIMFDTPVLLEADTDYHWTQKIHAGDNGWYGQGPSNRVEDEEGGLVVEFQQTGDGMNNGTSNNRGQLPVLFYAFPSTGGGAAAAAGGDAAEAATGSSAAAGGPLACVGRARPRPEPQELLQGADGNTLRSLVQLLQWGVRHCERDPSQPDSGLGVVASSAALRLLGQVVRHSLKAQEEAFAKARDAHEGAVEAWEAADEAAEEAHDAAVEAWEAALEEADGDAAAAKAAGASNPGKRLPLPKPKEPVREQVPTALLPADAEAAAAVLHELKGGLLDAVSCGSATVQDEAIAAAKGLFPVMFPSWRSQVVELSRQVADAAALAANPAAASAADTAKTACLLVGALSALTSQGEAVADQLCAVVNAAGSSAGRALLAGAADHSGVARRFFSQLGASPSGDLPRVAELLDDAAEGAQREMAALVTEAEGPGGAAFDAANATSSQIAGASMLDVTRACARQFAPASAVAGNEPGAAGGAPGDAAAAGGAATPPLPSADGGDLLSPPAHVVPVVVPELDDVAVHLAKLAGGDAPGTGGAKAGAFTSSVDEHLRALNKVEAESKRAAAQAQGVAGGGGSGASAGAPLPLAPDASAAAVASYGTAPIVSLLRRMAESSMLTAGQAVDAAAASADAAVRGAAASLVSSLLSGLTAAVASAEVEAGVGLDGDDEEGEESAPASKPAGKKGVAGLSLKGVKLGEPLELKRLPMDHGVGWGYGGSPDNVCVKVEDDNVFVAGFGCYGGQKTTYRGKIEIREGQNVGAGEQLAEEEFEYDWDDGDDKYVPVMFEEPVPLEPDQQYVFTFQMSGPFNTYSGGGGNPRMEGEDGTVFHFSNAMGANNGTCNNSGQIPAIYYYIVDPKKLKKKKKKGGKGKKKGGKKVLGRKKRGKKVAKAEDEDEKVRRASIASSASEASDPGKALGVPALPPVGASLEAKMDWLMEHGGEEAGLVAEMIMSAGEIDPAMVQEQLEMVRMAVIARKRAEMGGDPFAMPVGGDRREPGNYYFRWPDCPLEQARTGAAPMPPAFMELSLGNPAMRVCTCLGWLVSPGGPASAAGARPVLPDLGGPGGPPSLVDMLVKTLPDPLQAPLAPHVRTAIFDFMENADADALGMPAEIIEATKAAVSDEDERFDSPEESAAELEGLVADVEDLMEVVAGELGWGSFKAAKLGLAALIRDDWEEAKLEEGDKAEGAEAKAKKPEEEEEEAAEEGALPAAADAAAAEEAAEEAVEQEEAGEEAKPKKKRFRRRAIKIDQADARLTESNIRLLAMLCGVFEAADDVLSIAESRLHEAGAPVLDALRADPLVNSLLPLALTAATQAAGKSAASAAFLSDLAAGLSRRLDALLTWRAPTADDAAAAAALAAAGEQEGKGGDDGDEDDLVAGGAAAGGAAPLGVAAERSAAVATQLWRPQEHEVVLETAHPYPAAQKQRWDVSFPPSVRWVVVRHDPQCATVQEEDCCRVYLDHALRKPFGQPMWGQPGAEGEWPSLARPLVVPGHKLSVTFETASDYVDNPVLQQWGVKLLLTGYALPPRTERPLEQCLREAGSLAGLCVQQAALLPPPPLRGEEADADEDGEGADGSEKKKKKRKPLRKGGKVKGKGSRKGFVEVDWEIAEEFGVTIDDDLVRGNGTGMALLSTGISSGTLRWHLHIEQEDNSQATCLGVAKDSRPPGQQYSSPGYYVWRVFNGSMYFDGRTVKTVAARGADAEHHHGGPGGQLRGFQGDDLYFELDMDAGVLSVEKNDSGEEYVLFDNLETVDDVLYPCIAFYGANRATRIMSVEADAAACKELGIKGAKLPGGKRKSSKKAGKKPDRKSDGGKKKEKKEEEEDNGDGEEEEDGEEGDDGDGEPVDEEVAAARQGLLIPAEVRQELSAPLLAGGLGPAASRGCIAGLESDLETPVVPTADLGSSPQFQFLQQLLGGMPAALEAAARALGQDPAEGAGAEEGEQDPGTRLIRWMAQVWAAEEAVVAPAWTAAEAARARRAGAAAAASSAKKAAGDDDDDDDEDSGDEEDDSEDEEPAPKPKKLAGVLDGAPPFMPVAPRVDMPAFGAPPGGMPAMMQMPAPPAFGGPGFGGPPRPFGGPPPPFGGPPPPFGGPAPVGLPKLDPAELARAAAEAAAGLAKAKEESKEKSKEKSKDADEEGDDAEEDEEESKPVIDARPRVSLLQAGGLGAAMRIFAAALWHLELADDARAAAAFLKHRPELPKVVAGAALEEAAAAATAAATGPAAGADALEGDEPADDAALAAAAAAAAEAAMGDGPGDAAGEDAAAAGGEAAAVKQPAVPSPQAAELAAARAVASSTDEQLPRALRALLALFRACCATVRSASMRDNDAWEVEEGSPDAGEEASPDAAADADDKQASAVPEGVPETAEGILAALEAAGFDVSAVEGADTAAAALAGDLPGLLQWESASPDAAPGDDEDEDDDDEDGIAGSSLAAWLLKRVEAAKAGRPEAAEPVGGDGGGGGGGRRKKKKKAKKVQRPFGVPGGCRGERPPDPEARLTPSIRAEMLALTLARRNLPLVMTIGQQLLRGKCKHVPLARNVGEEDNEEDPDSDDEEGGAPRHPLLVAGPSKKGGRDRSLACGDVLEAVEVVEKKKKKKKAAEEDEEDEELKPPAGVHYFEVEVVSTGADNVVCVGLLPRGKENTRDHLGWKDGSCGYHADDGNQYGSGMPQLPKFGEGDIVGCGFVPSLDYVFYTLNGSDLGPRYLPGFFDKHHRKGLQPLRPAVTMGEGTTVRFNFGSEPFEFAEMEALREAAAGERAARSLRIKAAEGDDEAAAAAAALDDEGDDEDETVGLHAAAASPADAARRAMLLLAFNNGKVAAASAAALARAGTTGGGMHFGPDAEPSMLELTQQLSVGSAGGAPPADHPLAAFSAVPPGPPALVRSVSQLSRRSAAFQGAIEAAESSGDVSGAEMLATRPSINLKRAGAAASALLAAAVTGSQAPLLGSVLADETAPLVAASNVTEVPISVRGVLSFCVADGERAEVVLAAARALRERAVAKQSAFAAMRNLVAGLRHPLALEDMLWWAGTVIRSGAAAVSAEAEDEADEADEAGRDVAADGGLGSLRDLRGCGAVALARARLELHRLLEAAAELLSEGSSRGGTTTSLQRQALRCWSSPLSPADYAFMIESDVFSKLRGLIGDAAGVDADELDEAAVAISSCALDVTASAEVKVSHNDGRLQNVTDGSTETFWETGGRNRGDKWIQLTLKAPADGAAEAAGPDGDAADGEEAKEEEAAKGGKKGGKKKKKKGKDKGKKGDEDEPKPVEPHRGLAEVAVHIDGVRDKEKPVTKITLLAGPDEDSLSEIDEVAVPDRYTGWVPLGPVAGAGEELPVIPAAACRVLRIMLHGNKQDLRVRGVRLLARPVKDEAMAGGRPVRAEALSVFRSLVGRVFAAMSDSPDEQANVEDESRVAKVADNEEAAAQAQVAAAGAPPPLQRQGSELRQRVAGLLFGSTRSSSSGLAALRSRLQELIAEEMAAEAGKLLQARKEAASKAASGPKQGRGRARRLRRGRPAAPGAGAETDLGASAAERAADLPDAYAFELTGLVLSLASSSAEGLQAVAAPGSGLLPSTLRLLSLGSARVQRQCAAILERVLPAMEPWALDDEVRVAGSMLAPALLKDASAALDRKMAPLAADDVGADEDARERRSGRGALVASLLLKIASALQVRVRGRAGGRAVATATRMSEQAGAEGLVIDEVSERLVALLAKLWQQDAERAEEAGAGPDAKAAAAAPEAPAEALVPLADAGAADATWSTALKAIACAAVWSLPDKVQQVASAPAKSAHQPRHWAAAAALAVAAAVGEEALALVRLPSALVDQAPAPAAAVPVACEASAVVPLAMPAQPPPVPIAGPPADPVLSAAPAAAATTPAPAPAPAGTVFCWNHDDGVTAAAVSCVECAQREGIDVQKPHGLCAQCDVVLHLSRRARGHTRTPLQVEAGAAGAAAAGAGGDGNGPSPAAAAALEAAQVAAPVVQAAFELEDVDGGLRLKLDWLHVAVYPERRLVATEVRRDPAKRTQSGLPRCRFCDVDLTPDQVPEVPSEEPALRHVCKDEECQQRAAAVCTAVLPCGHFCGGCRGEEEHLPCYHGCDGVQIDPEDMCCACYTDRLCAGPAVQLECGHVFHAECMQHILASKWTGPAIRWGFMACPLCKGSVDHPALEEQLQPLRDLQEEHRGKALMRLKFEDLDKSPELSDKSSRWYKKPAEFAMDKFTYFPCYKCGKPYFGGKRECGAADGADDFDPTELVCAGCQPFSAEAVCPKHGDEFIEFKCRFCCSVSVWFCFGTTHFCDQCHRMPGDMQRMQTEDRLPECPAGPQGKQLEGDCPLGIDHPPTGEEFALGCSLCKGASRDF